MHGDGWQLALPDGFIAKPHKAWGYDSGAIARGWIGDAPVTVIVQVKRLDGGFNEYVRSLTRAWLEHDPPRRIEVAGASDAFRIDGYIEFDGLGAADDRERVAVVAAKAGGRVTAVTIRSRPEDELDAQLDPVLASFELVVEA